MADEPTTALDVSIQAQIIALLKRLAKEQGAAVMLVTHDMGVIAETCDRVAVMYAGRLVEQGPVHDVIHAPAHPYSRGLMGSIPAMDDDRERLLQIDGVMPRLNAIPCGCAFHPRCPQVQARCTQERPELMPAGATKAACWLVREGQAKPANAMVDATPRGRSMNRSTNADNPTTDAAAAATIPAANTTGPLVEVTNLAKVFDVSAPWLNRVLEGKPRQQVHAVDGVSFAIARGQTLALVGESGCGKSTVARLLVGLYPPTAGQLRFDGQNTRAVLASPQAAALRRRMQMIFQDPYASLNPRWRVRDIVAEPLLEHQLLSGQAALDERVGELLRSVGLAAADALKFPHQFSGGQRQRISIARALATQPEFLVCDEPTSALDVSVQAQVLNIMKDLQRARGLTYLFISHNLAVVRHVADTVGVMYLGRLVEVSPKRTLFSAPRHPYTRMLLDAIPDIHMSGRARTPVQGEVPNPLNPPTGCAFHPRCPLANARCAAERPVLKRRDGAQGELRAHRPDNAQNHVPDRVQVACHAVEEGRA